MWLNRQELQQFAKDIAEEAHELGLNDRHELAQALRALHSQSLHQHEAMMSALSDVTDSIAALSTSVDAAIAAKGDPAIAAALAADEAGLVTIKASLDDLKAKIDAALTSSPPA